MYPSKPPTPPIVYVYQCRSGIGSAPKYYVGTTTNFTRRHSEHTGGTGCEFTKQFSNLTCISVQLGGPDVELQIVLKYMSEYGIDNVRGGPWSQLTISPEEQKRIMAQLQSIADVCYTCGQSGHFASACTRSRAPPPRTSPPRAAAAAPSNLIQPPAQANRHQPPAPARTSPPTSTRTSPPAPAPAVIPMELDLGDFQQMLSDVEKNIVEPDAMPRRAISTPIDVAARVERAKRNPPAQFCHRCHREGHLAMGCVETTNGKNGSAQVCSRCDRVGHHAYTCRYTCSATGAPITRGPRGGTTM